MELRHRLRIVEKRWETPDTATFVLEPTDHPEPLSYQPGQFLSLVFKVNGREKRRAYSFSSSPAIGEPPAITVKRVINGEFSNWLLDHTTAGDMLESAGIAGQFLLPEPLPRTLTYVAAGSGITPVMSHLKTLLSHSEAPHILLVYANRDSANTIFKQQIDRWLVDYPERFACHYFFSREKNAANAVFGHLNNLAFEEVLQQYFRRKPNPRDRHDTAFFLCAPTGVMRMARMTLRLLDFPENHIHQEIFQAPFQGPERTLHREKKHRILVNKAGQQIEFQTFEGETILNAALRQGIDLPYTCKSGVCLTCLANCVSGTVEILFAGDVRREGPGSMVNTCIGYALSDEVELAFR